MKRGGVFWYGVAIALLSFIAVAGSDDGPVTLPLILDGLFAAGFNWLVFVLPVVAIRNIRRNRKAKREAAA